MIKAIYASNNKNQPTDMIEKYQKAEITLVPMHSGDMVLDSLSKTQYDLLITEDKLPDMSGKALIEKTTALNPFMNCAVISQLPHKLFHEKYEGLGVLMQLSPESGQDEAQKLMDYIKKVSGLLQKPKPRIKEV